RMGLDFQVLDSGCCGMAGSFGFEKDKYDVSVQIAERVLLPAVRQAAADTLIIADGFSCFQQIQGLTGRTPLHIAKFCGWRYKNTANQEVSKLASLLKPPGGGECSPRVVLE